MALAGTNSDSAWPSIRAVTTRFVAPALIRIDFSQRHSWLALTTVTFQYGEHDRRRSVGRVRLQLGDNRDTLKSRPGWHRRGP